MKRVKTNYDVLVIGGGPGGSTTAAYLGRMGYDVLLIEKSNFPRFHIGESLTGMAAEVIEDFALESQMSKHKFPVKGGVKVLGKGAKSEFFVSVLRPTWQVRRAEFDDVLLENAINHGVTRIKAQAKGVIKKGEQVIGLTYIQKGSDDCKSVYAKYIVDASGSMTFMSKIKEAGEQKFEDEFKSQVALFSHFKNVRRDPGAMGDNTFLFYSDVNEWAWLIPLSKDTVSIGIVIPAERIRKLGGMEKTVEWGIENINPQGNFI